uniref:ShKT domain-containing protein n=1 Tax=Rhabditophanes sp. KR3021 TaxID=114890 RepID=A0AC35U238_9BILA
MVRYWLIYVVVFAVFAFGEDKHPRLPKRNARIVTKDVIDFCQLNITNSCGREGQCMSKRSGNRCKCPEGWMGHGCRRPCQDIYKSCTQWVEHKRCEWAKPISPFFADNCPLSCGQCQSNGFSLPIPLPPILEHVSFMIGRWKTTTATGQRYPRNMDGPYTEVLDISITEVPAFDRPPLNFSCRAQSLSSKLVNTELGFITIKPFLEDTGFVEFDKPSHGPDKIGLEMASNTGIITIEEGVIKKDVVVLEMTHQKDYFNKFAVDVSMRIFKVDPSKRFLTEVSTVTFKDGRQQVWKKVFTKEFDYLNDF